MGKQEIVHFPKPTLRACGFGGLGCLLGMRVNSRAWVMADPATHFTRIDQAEVSCGSNSHTTFSFAGKSSNLLCSASAAWTSAFAFL